MKLAHIADKVAADIYTKKINPHVSTHDVVRDACDMKTTAERSEEALAAIKDLIGWARADMESSYESGATAQGDNDRQRVSWLMQAKILVTNAAQERA